MAKQDQNIFQKLTRLFRSGPVVKRKIETINTSVAMPTDSKSSAVSVFQRSTTPTYNNITSGAFSQQERMSRYQDFCFGADTLISTLDGVFTIKELSEKYQNGEQFFVHSYDYEKKTPVIGTAFYPRISRAGEKTTRLRITFDDGGFVDVTPDHKFILRSAETVEAKDLTVGTSLMPLYISDINGSGYNWIYLLGKTRTKSGWIQEHKLVAEQFYGHVDENSVVHHKDFNRKNNHPSNLKIMNAVEHRKFHAQLNNRSKFGKPNSSHSTWMRKNGNRNFTITLKEIVSAYNILETKSFKAVAKYLGVSGSVIDLRIKEVGFKNWTDFKDRFAFASQIATDEIIKRETISPSIELILEESVNSQTLEELSAKLSCTRNSITRRLNSYGIVSWQQLKTEKAYSGKKKGPLYTGPAYQQICNSFSEGMTKKELANSCLTTENKISTCLKNNGFNSFAAWSQNQLNHKVKSIEEIEDDVVYTITVEKHHNLAVGSINPSCEDGKRPYSFVFACQCEMEQTAEISAALDLYADETVAQDEKGRTLHIYSNDPKIRKLLEELFYDNLNVEFNLRPWARNLVKYGDLFLYNDVSPEYGVVNVLPIPINEIERLENYDPRDPSAVKFRWNSLGQRELQNWEVTHIRLLGNDTFLPYGSSILEGARRIWRQLILIEDAMLVYRIVRAPERRVFYIDLGNISPEESQNYLEMQKKALRSQSVVDATTSRVDLRYNPLSVDEDIFIGMREGDGTKIDTLPAGQNVGTVEDVAYIQNKLLSALKVPKAYLGFSEGLSSKASLAQMDIRFSRTISMIQKMIISELNKLAIIHLYVHGFNGEDLLNFNLKLSNPSTVAEQQKLELFRTKFEIASSAPESMLSRDWIRSNVLNLPPEEQIKIDRQLIEDAQIKSVLENAAAGADAGFGGGGGGGPRLVGSLGISGDEGDSEEGFPDEGGETPEGGAEPPAENAGPIPYSNREGLLTSADDIWLDDDFEIEEESENPVKKNSAADRNAYNRSRRRTHGASKTHMPDFARMTGNDTPEMSDPYDSAYISSYSKITEGSYLGKKLPYNIEKMIIEMEETLKIRNESLLSENASNSLGHDEQYIDLDDLDNLDFGNEDEQ